MPPPWTPGECECGGECEHFYEIVNQIVNWLGKTSWYNHPEIQRAYDLNDYLQQIWSRALTGIRAFDADRGSNFNTWVVKSVRWTMATMLRDALGGVEAAKHFGWRHTSEVRDKIMFDDSSVPFFVETVTPATSYLDCDIGNRCLKYSSKNFRKCGIYLADFLLGMSYTEIAEKHEVHVTSVRNAIISMCKHMSKILVQF